MFEDSLLESTGRIKSKQGRTTTVAFTLEIVCVCLLLLYPLVVTEALPMKQLMATVLVAPPPPPPPPPPAAAPVMKVVKVETEIVNGQLRTPTKIPEKVKMIKEDQAPPPAAAVAGVVGGVPGGIPGGQIGGVIGGIVSSVPVAVPKVSAPPPQKIRVSQGVLQGSLIHNVNPVYPPIARQARVQGSVVLNATIGKDGTIQNLRVASGHPMLVNAALEAVKQWRYKPYMLSGEPVEVETVITVNFNLSGS